MTLAILCTATIAHTRSNVSELNRQAWRLLKKQRYSQALTLFRRILRKDPEDARACWGIRTVHNDGTGQYTLAAKYARKAFSLYEKSGRMPSFWYVIFHTRMLFHRLKQHRTAFRFMRRMKRYYGKQPLYYHHLGNLYKHAKKNKPALSCYRKAFRMYKKAGKKPPLHLYTGMIRIHLYRKPYQYTRAIGQLKSILNDTGYSYKSKQYCIVWLAHGYIKTGQEKQLLQLLKQHPQRMSSSKRKQELYCKTADYYYKQKNNIKKALYYAKLAGRHTRIYKRLSPRILTLTLNLRFRKMMERHLAHRYQPGIIRITLPIDRPYQKILSVTSKPAYRRIFKVKDRNYIEFDFTGGYPERLIIAIRVKYKVVNAMPKRIVAVTDPNAEQYYYTKNATRQYDINNPILIRFIKKLTAKKRTLKEKVIAVWRWLPRNLHFKGSLIRQMRRSGRYRKLPPIRKISDVYRYRYCRDCGDISDLFIGLMRILKIPARRLGTMTHIQAEIYNAETGRWMYIEPQGLVPLGLNPAKSTLMFGYRMKHGERHPDRCINIGLIAHIHHRMPNAKKFYSWKVEYVDAW